MQKPVFKTAFGQNIFDYKYAKFKGETWTQRAFDLVEDVCGSRWGKAQPLMSKEDQAQLRQYIVQQKFLPGGRYIWYAGRGHSYFNNCFLLRAEEDTREEWADVTQRAVSCLMTGGGIGIDYSRLRAKGRPLTKTGGTASGPLPLMQIINEVGRGVMQGGSRRSALYASMNWKHDDINDFIVAKNWSPLHKSQKEIDFNFPAPLDMTNISVNFDDASLLGGLANNEIFKAVCGQAMQTGEPGFSFNFGDKQEETLRNACVTGDTLVLTKQGHQPIKDLIGQQVSIWNGESWEQVMPFDTGTQQIVRIELTDGTELDVTENHKWVINGEFKETKDLVLGDKLDKFPMPVLDIQTSTDPSNAYSQGFYSGDGNEGYTYSWVYEPKYSCIPALVGTINLSTANRKVWHHQPMSKDYVPINESLEYKLKWLAGLLDADGVVTRDINGNGFQIASINKDFLLNVKLMLTTLGVCAKVVFNKEASIRSMPDGRGGSKEYSCKELYRILIGNQDSWSLMQLGLPLLRLKHNNVKPQRDARQFVRIKTITYLNEEQPTFCFTEPKTSRGTFNGIVTGQCTEVTSEDDSDVCNLGSINLGNISSIEELKAVVNLGSKFLVCGTLRADLPYEKVYKVREKNRRLGLGLMGVHEWLLQRKEKYEVTPELHEWLKVYKKESERSANEHCDRFFISRPKAYRAIAPTGSIGILAGTTTGIEPLFAVAYKRRFLTNGTQWKYQYVVDGTAQALIDQYGVNPNDIDTAIDLCSDFERRIKFQADVQDYVDMSISSTINLPSWGSELNNQTKVKHFSEVLAKYAQRLRGFTCYPDGSRGGQPLTSVPYEEALEHKDTVYDEVMDVCSLTGGGTCGS